MKEWGTVVMCLCSIPSLPIETIRKVRAFGLSGILRLRVQDLVLRESRFGVYGSGHVASPPEDNKTEGDARWSSWGLGFRVWA